MVKILKYLAGKSDKKLRLSGISESKILPEVRSIQEIIEYFYSIIKKESVNTLPKYNGFQRTHDSHLYQDFGG